MIICSTCGIEKHHNEFYNNTYKCKECVKAYRKEYNKRDYVKERKKALRQTDHYKEYQKAYKQSSKYKEYAKKYNNSINNKIKAFIRNCKHRTKVENICNEEELKKCLEFFNYCDAYTGEPLDNNISFDHAVPVAKGGQSTINNIVPCKKEINQDKRNSTLKIWYIEQPFYTDDRYNKIKLWIESN